jgi:serine protease AprX
VKFYSDYPQGKPLHKPDVTAPFGGFPVWGRPGEGKVVATPEHSVVGEQFSEIQALVIGPQGNSFSCPHTAGVAALVLSANPELNPWEVKQIMEQTCKDLGDRNAYGAGLLQARDAVRAAKKVKK